MGTTQEILELVEVAFVGKLFLSPSLEDDFEAFVEAAPAFAEVHPEAFVDKGEGGASDAEVQPPLADVVEGGDFLGHTHRVAQRQHLHRQPDTHTLGAGGDGGGDGHRRRQHGALRQEVVLGQPDAVGAQAFRLIHQLEGLGEHLPLAEVSVAGEFVEQSELHR